MDGIDAPFLALGQRAGQHAGLSHPQQRPRWIGRRQKLLHLGPDALGRKLDQPILQPGAGFQPFGVRPAVPGQALKTEDLVAPILAAWQSTTRTADVPVVATQPELTTEQARATLPKGLISSFTTHFPDNPVRTNNLRVAAARLNGTYVPKGGTLSLNALLGQRTPEKGYQKAQVIYDGRLTYDYGGGISQVSTTLFNAVGH